MDAGHGEEPGGASSMLAQVGWLHITVRSDTPFTSSPGNREVVHPMLQRNKGLAEL